MKKTADDIRSRVAAEFSDLSVDKQCAVLAILGSRLSYMGRDAYNVSGGSADGARLRQLNEAQHRIFVQLSHLLSRDPRRYPDDVFANVMVDQLDGLDLDATLLEGIIRSV